MTKAPNPSPERDAAGACYDRAMVELRASLRALAAIDGIDLPPVFNLKVEMSPAAKGGTA